MIIMVGALAYFGVISWYGVITAAIALILVTTIISTRKLAYS
jgi:hypothetical protein